MRSGSAESEMDNKIKPKMLSQSEAAQVIGITAQCLNQWRYEKRDMPPYVKIGRIIRYPEDGLYQWLESKTHSSDNIAEARQHSWEGNHEWMR
jgi:predicted DNA-binding transcriptional regulator AlpA